MGYLPSEVVVQCSSTSLTRQTLDVTASITAAIQSRIPEDDCGAQFNIDRRTGFMAPRPRSRLPAPWDIWEDAVDAARQANLQVGDKIGLTSSDAATSSSWRRNVRQMKVLSTEELESSEILLRHAHVVLAHILHFYVHTLPPSSPISIPPSISVPILYISQRLAVPPVITYADNVLYNWTTDGSGVGADDAPTVANVRSMTTFTNLIDEEEFYLASARIELRGVEALDLMNLALKTVRNVSDDARPSKTERLTKHLLTLSSVIDELKDLLMDMKKLCDPDRYYNQVRPWLRGEDAFSTPVRKWIFEGIEAHPGLSSPRELSGPSAGQSCLIHALDVFFGVDHEAGSSGPQAGAAARHTSLMTRMQEYMPLEQRRFLRQLRGTAPSVRRYVVQANDEGLLAAYNRAVGALKGFRDAHMIIVTLYILGPARRAAGLQTQSVVHTEESANKSRSEVVKGTGGTDLVKFLKDTRARTTDALLHVD